MVTSFLQITTIPTNTFIITTTQTIVIVIVIVILIIPQTYLKQSSLFSSSVGISDVVSFTVYLSNTPGRWEKKIPLLFLTTSKSQDSWERVATSRWAKATSVVYTLAALLAASCSMKGSCITDLKNNSPDFSEGGRTMGFWTWIRSKALLYSS